MVIGAADFHEDYIIAEPPIRRGLSAFSIPEALLHSLLTTSVRSGAPVLDLATQSKSTSNVVCDASMSTTIMVLQKKEKARFTRLHHLLGAARKNQGSQSTRVGSTLVDIPPACM